MDAQSLLLTVAFRHIVRAPNVEAGFERVAALAREPLAMSAFHEAVAACLRDGMIRDPVRLPENALQCHWHLELTPKGVAEVRARAKA